MSRCGVWVLAALLLCAPAGFGQNKKKNASATRSVQGVVTSVDNTPVSGALVKLKNTRSLEIRSFVTQDNGSYRFFELSPDIDYELTAQYKGESSSTKTLSSFDSRREATINLKLNPAK